MDLCLIPQKHPERTKVCLGSLIQSSLAKEQENLMGEKCHHSRYDCHVCGPICILRPEAAPEGNPNPFSSKSSSPGSSAQWSLKPPQMGPSGNHSFWVPNMKLQSVCTCFCHLCFRVSHSIISVLEPLSLLNIFKRALPPQAFWLLILTAL